jgi:hypothetical protein
MSRNTSATSYLTSLLNKFTNFSKVNKLTVKISLQKLGVEIKIATQQELTSGKNSWANFAFSLIRTCSMLPDKTYKSNIHVGCLNINELEHRKITGSNELATITLKFHLNIKH